VREQEHVKNSKGEKGGSRYKAQVAVSQTIFLPNPPPPSVTETWREIDRISYAEQDRSLMNHPQCRVSECEQKNEHGPRVIRMT